MGTVKVTIGVGDPQGRQFEGNSSDLVRSTWKPTCRGWFTKYEIGSAYDSGLLKSCMLNEDFTEVEWVRQTDQVLVIKDRCSARVAAPVPKEPEQLPGPNRARIVQERASTPLRLHRRQAWGKQEST